MSLLKTDKVKQLFAETLEHVARSDGYAVAHAHRDAVCDLLEAVAVQAVLDYETRGDAVKSLISELRQT